MSPVAMANDSFNQPAGLRQAYADYEDVMKMSEDLLSAMVLEIKGSHKIQYHAVRCAAVPDLISCF